VLGGDLLTADGNSLPKYTTVGSQENLQKKANNEDGGYKISLAEVDLE